MSHRNRLLKLHAHRNGSFIPGAPLARAEKSEAYKILLEGELFHRRGDTVRARLCYREVLRRVEDKHSRIVMRAMFLMALVCYQARIYDEALLFMDYVRQDAAEWQNPEVHYNIGMIFHATGRIDDAIESYRTCLALRPAHAAAETHLGNLYREIGDLETAELCYNRVLARDIRDPNARYNLAFVPLMRGDLQRGFELYESRLVCEGYMAEYGRPDIVGPRWTLASRARSVLVWSEQGSGDAIQFLRYVPKLIARGLTVTVEIQEPALSLLAPFAGPHLRFIPLRKRFTDYDAHVSMLSLPALFGTTLETIPPPFPLAPTGPAPLPVRQHARGPVVGVAWAGNPNHHNDRRRSAPLLPMAPLFLESGPDITWVTLQHGHRGSEAHRMAPYLWPHFAREGLRFVDASGALHTFADTVNLIASLDLVITVDTLIAHLAGSMGKPVWMMPPIKGEWRWLEQGEHSPWYPSMRIFRHGPDNQWAPLARRIAETFRAERAV